MYWLETLLKEYELQGKMHNETPTNNVTIADVATSPKEVPRAVRIGLNEQALKEKIAFSEAYEAETGNVFKLNEVGYNVICSGAVSVNEIIKEAIDSHVKICDEEGLTPYDGRRSAAENALMLQRLNPYDAEWQKDNSE